MVIPREIFEETEQRFAEHTEMGEDSKHKRTSGSFRDRWIIAFFIGALSLAYVIGLVSGNIPKDRQIDATVIALIVLSAISILFLVRPDSFSRLKLLEMAGFKLELLEKVREKQEMQQVRLDDIRWILPLLLPETERNHLFNLERGQTKEYIGRGSLRAELRRLRSIGLIEMVNPDRHIAQLQGGGKFNLADYVRLTKRGRQWVTQIQEIEKAEANDKDNEK
jgi:hypothetical protein